MPKCFFNIRDLRDYHRDTVGHECNSIEQMEAEAAITAASLAKDNATKGFHGSVCVEVMNEKGKMIAVATAIIVVERIDTDSFMS